MERHFFSSRGGRNAKPGKKLVGLAECAGRLGRIKEGEDRRSDSENLGFGRSALEGLGRTSNREFSTPSRDGRRIASRIPPGHLVSHRLRVVGQRLANQPQTPHLEARCPTLAPNWRAGPSKLEPKWEQNRHRTLHLQVRCPLDIPRPPNWEPR